MYQDRLIKRQYGSQKLGILAALLIIAIISLSGLLFIDAFEVREVAVSGNTHYSDVEIESLVMSGRLGRNSLFLKLKYRNKPIKDIPFIERMDVVIDSPHKVTIRVFEKALAGCLNYLGGYIYFDREGIAVESSARRLEDCPYVTGLKFDHCILGEPLPVKDPKVFEKILSIAQLLKKYEIKTDRIYFSADGKIILFFGDTRAELGTMDNIDEKMIRLRYIVPELKGRRGVLHMDNYSEESDKDYVTFEKE